MHKGKQPLITKWQEILGLDKRSIALFRVSIALVALVDALHRLVDVRAHYTGKYVGEGQKRAREQEGH